MIGVSLDNLQIRLTPSVLRDSSSIKKPSPPALAAFGLPCSQVNKEGQLGEIDLGHGGS